MPPPTPTSPSLRREHMLGFRTNLSCCGVHYLDDTRIAYPCDNIVVVLNVETTEQRFLETTKATNDIVNIAVSPNRRLLAVAETGEDKQALVCIYDVATLKKRKVLRLSEEENPSILHFAFVGSKSCLVLACGLPRYNLTLWSIEKAAAKPIASVKLATPSGKAIYWADASPVDSSIVCVTGNGVLRFYRVVDNSFRPVTVNLKRQQQNYVAHRWLSNGQLIVGMENGDLIVIENFAATVVLSISQPLLQAEESSRSICSIAEFSRGIIVGSQGGTLHVHNRVEDAKKCFGVARRFIIKDDTSDIMGLAMSPSGDTLVCSTTDKQMYSFPLSSVDILDQGELALEHVLPPFHRPGQDGTLAEIRSMDVCLWRPIVATCGADNSVRIWNYQQGDNKIEVVQQFDSRVLGISLHPTGFYILICAEDQILCCAILALPGTLETTWRVPKKTLGLCSFSNGGHYFAVVLNTTVQVFNSYTFAEVCSLRSSGIKCISWKDGDRRLCTIGADGVLCIWSVPQGRQLERHVNALSAIDPTFKHACESTEKSFKKIDVDILPNLNLSIDNLILSKSGSLIIGTDTKVPGALRIISTDGQSHSGCEVHVQSGLEAISCLAFSGSVLFAANQDGTLCAFRLDCGHEQSRSLASNGQCLNKFLSDEILISESRLNERTDLIESLDEQLRELRQSNEDKLCEMDAGHRETMATIRSEQEINLSEHRRRHQAGFERNSSLKSDHEQTLSVLEAEHAADMAELRRKCDNKTSAETKRLEDLERNVQGKRGKWDHTNELLVKKQQQELQDVTNTMQETTQDEIRLHAKLLKQRDEHVSRHAIFLHMLEEDADEEITALMAKYEEALLVERRGTKFLKEENGILKKKHEALTKDLDEQRETIASLEEKETEVLATIKELEETIANYKSGLQTKEETILKKERDVACSAGALHKMEEHKRNLGDKVKELKACLQPNESKIASKQNEIIQMDFDLEESVRKNATLQLFFQQLGDKVAGLKVEIEGQHQSIQDKTAFIGMLEKDIDGVARSQALKASLLPLFKKYLKNGLPNGIKMAKATNIHGKGSERQEEHLRKEIDNLKSRIEQSERKHIADMKRLRREKAVLRKVVIDLDPKT